MNNPYLAPADAASYGAPPPGPAMVQGAPYGDDRAGVSDAAVEMLRQTKPWVMFLSVMSFLGSGFMLLGGISMIALGSLAPKGAGGPIPAAALGAVYLPLAFLYIYPALKLWSYGSAIGRLVNSRNTFDLEAALAQQKSFWKFAGITTIVLIALYVVFFIGMIAVGIAAAGRP